MKTMHVVANTITAGWEEAIVRLWDEGSTFPTEYDKPDDPASRDACLMLEITDPMAEPRVHKRFPGGLEDLEKYRAEVLYGVHDHWVDTSPGSTKWDYTYHQRMRQYRIWWAEVFGGEGGVCREVDQVSWAVNYLRKTPHTRRCVISMWQPWLDPNKSDPPCVQYFVPRIETVPCDCANGWKRVLGLKPVCPRCKGTRLRKQLNLSAHMRSNDGFKAAFMNIYAFTEFQAALAAELGVEVGTYVHIADSFHIYGSYFDEYAGFLRYVATNKDRFWTTDFCRPMFIEGVEQLLAETPCPKEDVLRRRLSDLEKQMPNNSL